MAGAASTSSTSSPCARATSGGLARATHPIGPDCDRHIGEVLREAEIVIVAWGSLKKLPEELHGRWPDIAAMAERAGARLHCFGTASDGHPLHPLTLSYDRPIIEWIRP
ncbi:DUF1643 domain-containing protein [Terrarubrum flagellatum]|uniref:DUF1643 domain-containing protein n=1 Tax=Terrirubrum flagellatum TaxID=2895980 RepID=UPI003145135C